MYRVISLIFVTFIFIACGGGGDTFKPDIQDTNAQSDDYIGTWEGEGHLYLKNDPTSYCKYDYDVTIGSDKKGTITTTLRESNNDRGICSSSGSASLSVSNTTTSGFDVTIQNSSAYILGGNGIYMSYDSPTKVSASKTFTESGYTLVRNVNLTKTSSTDSVDIGDTISSAYEISLASNGSGSYSSTLSDSNDYDYYEIDISQSGTYSFSTSGSTDTYGTLYNASGNSITSNDDGGSGTNFFIEESLDTGTYYISVSTGASSGGDYTIDISNSSGSSSAINDGDAGSDVGGRGDVSWTLTWSWENSEKSEGPDIDLWVKDPNGDRISGANPSHDILELDYDDRGGFGDGDGGGAERVYFKNSIVTGTYEYGVRWYEGDYGSVSYILKLYNDSTLVGTDTGTLTAPSSTPDEYIKVKSVNLTDNGGSSSPSNGTITHNGVTYGTVTSPHTGRVWLDRNLGASRVCTAYNDEDCYGDYYQWGRDADGHEKSNSDTTSTQATNVTTVGHDDFITSSSTYSYDWAKNADSDGSIRSANWSKTDGTSVCPVGFRVPTIDELKAETVDITGFDNQYDAYESFLKLPSAGYRGSGSGSHDSQGSYGYVWSSSPFGSYAGGVYFYSSGVDWGSFYRANGRAVRCLRD
jgi:hypothetical protein